MHYLKDNDDIDEIFFFSPKGEHDTNCLSRKSGQVIASGNLKPIRNELINSLMLDPKVMTEYVFTREEIINAIARIANRTLEKSSRTIQSNIGHITRSDNLAALLASDTEGLVSKRYEDEIIGALHPLNEVPVPPWVDINSLTQWEINRWSETYECFSDDNKGWYAFFAAYRHINPASYMHRIPESHEITGFDESLIGIFSCEDDAYEAIAENYCEVYNVPRNIAKVIDARLCAGEMPSLQIEKFHLWWNNDGSGPDVDWVQKSPWDESRSPNSDEYYYVVFDAETFLNA